MEYKIHFLQSHTEYACVAYTIFKLKIKFSILNQFLILHNMKIYRTSYSQFLNLDVSEWGKKKNGSSVYFCEG